MLSDACFAAAAEAIYLTISKTFCTYLDTKCVNMGPIFNIQSMFGSIMGKHGLFIIHMRLLLQINF